MNSKHHTIAELLEQDSFRKWVQGEASIIQKEHWDNWVMESDENRELARDAMQEMTGFTLYPKSRPNTENAWSRFNKRLDREGNATNQGVTENDTERTADLKWIYRVAVGLLIILTAGMAVFFGYSEERQSMEPVNAVTEHKVFTNYGEVKTIKLEDGSVIKLNANSEIVYKVNAEKPTDIRVELNGEAFFNIAERNSSNQLPFQVVTDDGMVRVLGTKFSVSARDEKTEVVLEEGSVEVTSYQTTQQKKRQLILKPNHMAEFDNLNDTLIVRRVNTDVYTSWKTDELVFDRTPLPEVLARIEHTFGVRIEVKDPSLKQRTLSGTIDNSKIDVILSTLSQTLSTPVEIDGKTVYIGNDEDE